MARELLTDRVMKVFLSVLLLSLVALPACQSRGPGDASASSGSARLILTGSSTVAPLAAEIAKRFEAENDGVRIDVQTGGSSRGIADARSGLADIGMASRGLKTGEQEGLVAHTIARDGIALIVHSDNSVKALSDEQVRSIYLGRTTNWREVGGPDAEITVVNKASGRATLEVFLAHFGLEETAIEADVVIGDNEQGVKTVAGNPHAIGYVSIGTAEFNSQDGVPIRLLPAGSVEASTANVAKGLFPIGRPLNLITNGELDELSKSFIEYASSSQVHDLVRDLYFVPVSVQ